MAAGRCLGLAALPHCCKLTPCLHILPAARAQLLPGSPADTEARLGEVQRELAALDAQQAAIASRGAWRSRAFVWAGLTSQLALWGLLFRLTYYELSWDVMEPICFFTSGFQALVSAIDWLAAA